MARGHLTHYDYLNKYFSRFLDILGLDSTYSDSIISCDGDKCYGYQMKWEAAGVPFNHGVMLYLITKFNPYSETVRQTQDGWVDPGNWVLVHYVDFIEAIRAAESVG